VQYPKCNAAGDSPRSVISPVPNPPQHTQHEDTARTLPRHSHERPSEAQPSPGWALSPHTAFDLLKIHRPFSKHSLVSAESGRNRVLSSGASPVLARQHRVRSQRRRHEPWSELVPPHSSGKPISAVLPAYYSFDREDSGVCKVGNNQSRRGMIARSCKFDT